ncbi:nucleoside hydrolase [Terrarubrum flagellatum]|uniref:nucleoside hydrolase n=1 Tax=Terrirubrum flagellatum TaxID=2895980 RepID=UPI00314530A6
MKRRIIIDCDPGVDDSAAILLALASPELDVLGLSVVGGNVPLAATTRNACKIAELAGRPKLPIYAGCPGPLVRPQIFGKYVHIGAFSDELLPPPAIPLAEGHAVQFIVREACAAAAKGETITLCCMAPLTNVALALLHDEQAQRGIDRIVMMGGAFSALGNRAPWAEFNILADPHAAEIVFTSGVPVVMMPLDVTFQALMTEDHLARLRRLGGAPAKALASLISAFDRSDHARFGRPGGPLHDATVIAWLLRPDLFKGRPAAVGVATQGVTSGHTYADFYGKGDRPINAEVMQNIDAEGFFDLLIERLSRKDERDSKPGR